MMKPVIAALVLFSASFAHAQFVQATYLAGNELWHAGVVRIHAGSSDVTVTSPLTVEVIACDAKGEMLKPRNGPMFVDWASGSPRDQVLTNGTVTEIPIGTYRSGLALGAFETALCNYDLSAIARVWIYFPVQVEKLGKKIVTVEAPNEEVRRVIGRRVGG
jgi:hypothetical protein